MWDRFVSPFAGPGEVLCLTGDLSGPADHPPAAAPPGSPAVYSGGGEATVKGIDVTADNVVVEGFTSTDGSNMGAKLVGNNITFRDNTITHPVYDGDDTDGIRFFGDDITILHNSITDVSDGSDCNQDGCNSTGRTPTACRPSTATSIRPAAGSPSRATVARTSAAHA